MLLFIEILCEIPKDTRSRTVIFNIYVCESHNRVRMYRKSIITEKKHQYKINIQKACADNDPRCVIAIKFQIPLFIRQKLGHKVEVIVP